MKLTKQGVRDLNHIPSKLKGKKPSTDAKYLAAGLLPPCQHRMHFEESYDEYGPIFVKVCSICGIPET